MKYVLSIFLPGLLLGGAALVFCALNGYLLFVLLGWMLVSGLGVAVGFHRVFSHRTHSPAPWLDNLLLFLGTLAGQGSSISWVAVHRGYHHRFADTEKDLHSPIAHGFWQALFGWYLTMDPKAINNKYSVELLRRKNHVLFHRHYTKILYGFALALLLISPIALAVYGAVLCIALLQDNLVNAMCHKFGYRNFDIKDGSTNFWPLGYFGWGQGWHNNHHAFPADFNFGKRWWEFDPCVIFLPLLKLGDRK